MKTVAIVGASGYTGRELLRLLAQHPRLRATAVMTARPGTAPEAPAFPTDPTIDPLDLARLASVDGVFLCTPHGAASDIAKATLALGRKVVDLSADFRLRDPQVYAKAYGAAHPAPELLAEAVYGLTEHTRDAVAAARLVANPGCYPTSILLPLLPLLQQGLVAVGAPIVADSKSGTSGAGKAPSERTHFGNVHENFCAYGVGTHRHVPEIHQEARTDRIVFTPHLLPVFRGMLSTIYVTPAPGVTAEAVRSCLQERYAREPFVRVYPKGQPELSCVQRTNQCHIAVAPSGPMVVLVSAIDNLGRTQGRRNRMRILVKIGGAQLEEAGPRSQLCKAVANARAEGHEVIVVHGGGNQIRQLGKALGIEDRYHEGLRITDARTAEVVLMVLGGQVNRTLVASLQRAGVQAVGLSGADGATFAARKLEKPGVDLGFVGAIDTVRPQLVLSLLASGNVPVLATVAPGVHARDGEPFFNLNADHAAGPLCKAFGCDAVLFLTDVPGVLGADQQLLRVLTPADCDRLAKTGVATGGMLPKLDAALMALRDNPRALVKIAPAGEPDAVLRALRQNVGTSFVTSHSALELEQNHG